MDNWLLYRLTPAKAAEDRWAELAEALEQLWETFFDPELSRYQRMRSSYLMDDADLARKIREMGDYFSYELPKEQDRPVALAWRRLEIEYKDMELILRSAFRRHFGDFKAEWFPLFAAQDKPYGTDFQAGDFLLNQWEKNIPPEGYWLTSRGVVGVDKADLYRERMDKALFRKEAIPLVSRIKPLHIVFNDFLWFMRYNFDPLHIDIDATWEHERRIELQFSPLGSRFDYLPADARHLDIDVLQTQWETERILPIPFWDFSQALCRLDNFLPDGFGDMVPVDTLRRVTGEHCPCHPLTMLYRETDKEPLIIDVQPPALSVTYTVDRPVSIVPCVPETFTNRRETHKVFAFAYPDSIPHRLDNFLPDGFGDLLPLDTLRHARATETARIAPVELICREREALIPLPVTSTEFIQAETIGVWNPQTVDFAESEPCLDRLPLYDHIPADFMPVDCPWGGYI